MVKNQKSLWPGLPFFFVFLFFFKLCYRKKNKDIVLEDDQGNKTVITAKGIFVENNRYDISIIGSQIRLKDNDKSAIITLGYSGIEINGRTINIDDNMDK